MCRSTARGTTARVGDGRAVGPQAEIQPLGTGDIIQVDGQLRDLMEQGALVLAAERGGTPVAEQDDGQAATIAQGRAR